MDSFTPEIMMKFSFIVFVTVGFLVTFGKKNGLSGENFFSATTVYDWIKIATSCSRSTIFLVGIWWIWRHRNLMCLDNETRSLTRHCNNIHSSTYVISSGFERDNFCISFRSPN